MRTVRGGDKVMKDGLIGFFVLFALTVCIGFFTGVFYGVFKSVVNFIV